MKSLMKIYDFTVMNRLKSPSKNLDICFGLGCIKDFISL